jgi:hypothetical protein
MISGIGVFYPDKKPTQRVGIIPDVEPGRPSPAFAREETRRWRKASADPGPGNARRRN